MSGEGAAVTSEEIREQATCRIAMALHLFEGKSAWDSSVAQYSRYHPSGDGLKGFD